ncbi:MAG: polymorphic toxin type 44 domain-containing protein [Acidobacteriota bacterium]
MQPDAWAGSTSDPQSLNRYAYVGSDPINSVDPYGLFPIIFLPPLKLGQIGQITVTAQPDPIIPISSGIGPFGPGEMPVISIDVLSLLPPLPTPQQTKKKPCPPVPQHPKDADIDANIRRSQQHRPSGPFTAYGEAVWFRDMVKANAPWDYKRMTPDLRYEDFGNFNYGATGAAIGFPLITLYSEAGRVQGIPPGMSEKPKEWGYPAGRFLWRSAPWRGQA